MSDLTVKRALISVSDKSGLEDFARALQDSGVEILSTGGTAAALKKAGITVIDVSSHTGFPEIMDGRVKTLHPKIHGGILARRDDKAHLQAMNDHGIEGIDLLVVNLYPFGATVRRGAGFDECVENIDIGGPAMIRAAAKNHDFVAVVTDPGDYPEIAAHIKKTGTLSDDVRRALALKAFALTAHYDSSIAAWLADQAGQKDHPAHISFSGALKQSLRYGENPHQSAALYLTENDRRPGVAHAVQVQGKELSYNNLNDTNAAFELVAELSDPAVAIIKHANPCGVATGEAMVENYVRALACDPVSAFGGIIALNRPLDRATAEAIVQGFVEVIIAPSAEPGALAVLAKKDKIRVLTTRDLPKRDQARRIMTCVAGGFLVQDADDKTVTENDLEIVTKRAPSGAEIKDMLFAFTVAKHVKSNAIVYARDGATIGIGAGQMSRVDSSRIAAWKMKEVDGARWAVDGKEPSTAHRAPSTVCASDAFFPFADGLIAAAEAGVTAVIQPGGSIRDEEVIRAADERGLAMVFTGARHFRH